jgi:FAD/FMN-containing dehydrogenase
LAINNLVFQVRWAVENSVPFVTKSGGHSTWSTIGNEGFIIDLSNYSGITVDSSGQVAKLTGSILSKAVAVHLADKGYFAGNGPHQSLEHVTGNL